MRKLILLISICFFISGCQALQNLSDSIRKPSLSIEDMRITDFSFDEVELTYDVKVDNPNPVAVQLMSYDYDLNINENDFLEGSQDKQLRIESSGSSTFQIPVRLNFRELYELFSNLRDRDEADYRLAANLDFDLPVLGTTTLPLEKSGSLPMIKLPRISVSSLEVDEMNFSQANLTLNLQVDNPNGFGLLLKALSYDLSVNGRSWVDGSRSRELSISEKGSNQLAIPITLNISEIGSSVVQLLSNSSNIDYQLDGAIDFGAAHPLLQDKETTFEFNQNGDLPVIR